MLGGAAIVNPSHQPRDQPHADEVAERHEGAGLGEQQADRGEGERAAARQSRDQRQQEPSRGVVDQPGGQDQHPQFTAHQAELDQDFRDHRNRRDCDRHTHEECEDEPLVRRGEILRGQRQAQDHPRTERNHHPAHRHANGGASLAAQDIEVGFESDIEQEQDHAGPGEGLEQMARHRIAAKARGEQAGREVAEHRGADDHAGEQFADDRGLPQTLHQVAQRAAHQQQQGKLDQEAENLRFA